jgi:hypothetical protein
MLDAEGIISWVRGAKAGDCAVYARGELLPRAVAAVARRMQEQGLVALTHRREPDTRVFQHLMQRQEKPYAVARGQRRGRNYGPATAETVILRMIAEAIRLRQPCPTNAEFAEAALLAGADSASYRLRKLIAAGKIVLSDGGPKMRRVATMVESGLSTASGPL